jgi:hypothetical protein
MEECRLCISPPAVPETTCTSYTFNVSRSTTGNTYVPPGGGVLGPGKSPPNTNSTLSGTTGLHNLQVSKAGNNTAPYNRTTATSATHSKGSNTELKTLP